MMSSIIEIMNKFPNQETCVKFLEELRWNSKPKCIFCLSEETFPIVKELRHHCKKCNKSFSVTAGTVFHNTRVPLQKWFVIITLMTNAKKGISACQVARDTNLPWITVWRIMHKIRSTMTDKETMLLSRTIEMDETYIGGKPRKSNNVEQSTNNPRGIGTRKACVIGIIERNGNVKITHANNEPLTSEYLQKIVKTSVEINNSTLITDQYPGYSKMNTLLNHKQINHKETFSNLYGIHTNTIEGFWAILKRGIISQFHWISKKWLQYYLNEFCFKYNYRKEKSMFKILIIKCLLKNKLYP